MTWDRTSNERVAGVLPDGMRQRPRTPRWIRIVAGVLATIMGVAICALVAVGVIQLVGIRAGDSSTRTLALSARTPHVSIQNDAADLHIATTGENSITVRTERWATAITYDQAQQALARMTTEVRQDGDAVTITVRTAQLHAGSQELTLYVTVPQRTDLAVRTDAGHVHVRDITGNLSLETGAGNLNLDDVSLMGASSLRTGSGDIACRCALADAASVTVNADAGNIDLTLPQVTRATLWVVTDTGNISIASAWQIEVIGRTAGASANGELAPHPTGTISVQTKSGDVSVQSR